MLKLNKGDKVAVIAPASYLPNESRRFADRTESVLRSWGLQLVKLYDLQQKHFYLAGDDKYRADQLLLALKAPDVKAIFVTRGGYGCARLLPVLEKIDVPSPRLFCGFSDVTALALGMEGSNLRFIHGPNLLVESFSGDSCSAGINRDRLRDLLFKGEQGLQQSLVVLREGQATAAITGGCLSIVNSLLGTPYEPDFSAKILFLEDVGEKPYVIDRMLTQLLQAGKLDDIRGLVFGDMHRCTDHHNELKDVISDVLRDCSFPILYGFQAGHGPVNLAFAYNQPAEINTSNKSFRLLPVNPD